MSAPTTAPLDVAAVRARFPALRRTQDGVPVAYLDGPGGSQAPQAVIDAIADHLATGTANDDGAFATSEATNALLHDARVAAGRLCGSDPRAIAFGANMTTLNFLLAHAVARTLAPGDEVVVTDLDHDANVAPWLQVAADHGLVVRRAPVRTQDATLDHDALEDLLTERTRVVAFTLASNAVGSLTDAPRLAAAAHRVGALAWADGVHLAPHRRPDRTALGVDVLLCSPYKFFGPHLGIAALRDDLAEELPADRVRPAAEDPPGHRFETGTPSFEALAGTIAAIEHLASLGEDSDLDDAYARIRAHEEALARAFLARLPELGHVRLRGIAEPARAGERTPTFCFTVDGRAPRAVSEHLAARGLFTWDGNYYALALMQALGLEGRGGAVRAGLLHYATHEEVERLLAALEELGP
jgi:cysteine desulfurase family protein (TIGR01976 family)